MEDRDYEFLVEEISAIRELIERQTAMFEKIIEHLETMEALSEQSLDQLKDIRVNTR